MFTRRAPEHVLGVMATSRTLEAVLLKSTPDGPTVARRFSRQRTGRFGGGSVGDLPSAAAIPETAEAGMSGGDFTLQIGNGGGGSGSDLFLGSEFGSLGQGGGDEAFRAESESFALELGDLLAECQEAGFGTPTFVICLGTNEINTLEMRLPQEADSKGAKEAGDDGASKATRELPDESTLLKAFKEQARGSFDEKTVTFVPLTPAEDGGLRCLALYPKEHNAASTTIQSMRKDRQTLPGRRIANSEPTLYMGMARALEATGTTLVVRAGEEDTLVLFMDGQQLSHYEVLRSLTTYDAAETICSRVLLLQDEYSIGEVEHVLVLSGEREEELSQSFEMFFPGAQVASMRSLLPGADDDIPEGDSGSTPATIAALSILRNSGFEGHFPSTNLLEMTLRGRGWQLPFTWPVLTLYALIFFTVFFFVGRFVSIQSEISSVETELAKYPPERLSANADALQGRIDSLQSIYLGYTGATRVLDSLLVGSDGWTRGLEGLVNNTAGVSGIWVESWQPAGGSLLLQGQAISRDRVVQMAERLDGDIETLTFNEIRTWPVYAFQMRVPQTRELPEAVTYVRSQLEAEQAATN
ncbi:MAG: hypothetical protein AAGI71_19130 [Bacteroidota bacterium]